MEPTIETSVPHICQYGPSDGVRTKVFVSNLQVFARGVASMNVALVEPPGHCVYVWVCIHVQGPHQETPTTDFGTSLLNLS